MQRPEDSIGAFLLRPLQPWHRLVCALLFGAPLDQAVTESHANYLARLSVHALIRVLHIALVPPVNRSRRMRLPELRTVSAVREQDIDHDLSHLVIFECLEVDVVYFLDIRDECGENGVHVEGVGHGQEP